MDNYTSTGRSTTHLRELAERRIKKPNADAPDQASKLIYELQIHQEELEIQNEELRRAQLRLTESHDRYLDLYDFAPVGYLTLNFRSEVVEANLTACQMLGRERSRLIGARLDLLCQARQELRAHLKNVFASGERQSTELQFEVENDFWIQLQSCRSSSNDGDFLIRTVMTDISSRRKAERESEEKDRRLRALADALPVLIGYLDGELRYRFCNLSHRDWFGLVPEELHGRTIQEALGENFSDEIVDYLRDALEGRKVTFESVMTDRLRCSHHVQVTFVPDIGDAGKVIGVHVLCIDITERKLVEEQEVRRRTLSDKLDQLNSDERKVYELMVRGKANKAIAFQLDIGLRTAERRRQAVLRKLKFESIADLLQALANIQEMGKSEPDMPTD